MTTEVQSEMMARIDPKNLSDDRLESLIENYRTHNAIDRPKYRSFTEERNRRCGGDFGLHKIIEFVLGRARERRFSSYGEIAELHGADWSKVRHVMPHHLWDVVRWARSRGLPMLSAVIVNKQHVQSGDIEPETLTGFIGAAQELGYEVDDWHSFLREQQQECFAVARMHGRSIDEHPGYSLGDDGAADERRGPWGSLSTC